MANDYSTTLVCPPPNLFVQVLALIIFSDIHYYYAPDTSANDAAAKALRLRMTRSLWGNALSKYSNVFID